MRKCDLTPDQRSKEKAILKAIILDTSVLFLLTGAGLLSGSLTALSEIVRFALLLTIEYATYAVLKRAHREGFSEFEYGTGKIERITNLLVAFGLILSSLYIFSRIISMDEGAPISTTALMLTIIGGTLNMMINYYCSVDFIRSNEKEKSVIVSSQIAARIAKSVASAVVLGVLMLTLWLPDPRSARIVDLIGSVFLIGYMLIIAYGLIRESLPEILDRTIPEPEHFQIIRVLAKYFDNYDGFNGYKARRSGKDLFILINLAFHPERTMADVQKRTLPIMRDLETELPGAIVTVAPELSAAKV
ncbi:cation transporter [Maridesulfovibrio sp.]|uniref:cation diffusion facilitator family transporter n=1 Tax=Maridesulfovibrio sp. TaxID=2795000 RepID=UPI002A18914A|nr:cation transporter [Maridesulfovibrio sp.]